MSFGVLANPCLGSPCFGTNGSGIDPTIQAAGAVVMIAIVLALAIWGSRKWRGGGRSMAMGAPA